MGTSHATSHARNFLAASAALLLGCLATRARGDILYATQATNTIQRITGAGVSMTFALTALNPFGLAFDSAGLLYVAVADSNAIQRFNLSTGVGTTFASGLSFPAGLAFDSAGNLYAANNGNSTIERVTPGGITSPFAGTGLSSPYGLAFDRAGNLYAANGGDNTIEKFALAGGILSPVGSVFASTGLNQPTGLAFDGAGNLYVGNYGSSNGMTIEKFTPAGDASVFATTPKGTSGPFGLAFDSAGSLYVATFTGAIEKFSSTGVDLGAFASGLNGPRFIAFTNDAGVPLGLPVPEPASLGLLGLGACLLAARRRRQA